MPVTSPLVIDLAWGRMRVEGIGAGRDFKLWPGGGRIWNWGETDTHHVPGIQPADVEELLAHGSTIVVLSRGMERRLEMAPETLAYLRERGVTFVADETREAVARYNRLAESGAMVGGLFHSTC